MYKLKNNFNLSSIKTIQKKSVLIGSNDKTQQVEINKINPNNSIVFIKPYYLDDLFRPDGSLFGGTIKTENEILLERYEPLSASEAYCYGELDIIEFKRAKYKQSGTIDNDGIRRSTIYFDKSINTEKALISLTKTSTYVGTDAGEGEFLHIENLYSSGIELWHSEYLDKIFYEILELY